MDGTMPGMENWVEPVGECGPDCWYDGELWWYSDSCCGEFTCCDYNDNECDVNAPPLPYDDYHYDSATATDEWNDDSWV